MMTLIIFLKLIIMMVSTVLVLMNIYLLQFYCHMHDQYTSLSISIISLLNMYLKVA